MKADYTQFISFHIKYSFSCDCSSFQIAEMEKRLVGAKADIDEVLQ